MLTQLITVKARLDLDPFDVKQDALLTQAIQATSARFATECQRTFARTVNALEEFAADAREIRPACYPVEQILSFELKRNETEGWIEQLPTEYLIRRNCVVSLLTRLGSPLELGRLVYTGGYVLPGNEVGPGQYALPNDLEQATVEQVVYWFQNRDKLGIIRQWPKGGTYEQFEDLDLLPPVRSILKRYERCAW